MTEKREIVFGGGKIAEQYENVMVPLVFDPWAEMLIEMQPVAPGEDALDLATGTGIVARKLAARLGEGGSLTAADLSADMLRVAEPGVRAASRGAALHFVETPAHPLELESGSVDAIYCQQGFQFFPDGDAAAAELNRVARPGARVAVSVWCPLPECELFGALADSLRAIGEIEAAETFGRPFDHMPGDRFERHFVDAGFRDVSVERRARDLVFERGPDQLWEFCYATPLAPVLSGFDEAKTAAFRARLDAEAEKRTEGGVTRGSMAALVLSARK